MDTCPLISLLPHGTFPPQGQEPSISKQNLLTLGPEGRVPMEQEWHDWKTPQESLVSASPGAMLNTLFGHVPIILTPFYPLSFSPPHHQTFPVPGVQQESFGFRIQQQDRPKLLNTSSSPPKLSLGTHGADDLLERGSKGIQSPSQNPVFPASPPPRQPLTFLC